jgi:putative transposase
VVIVYKLTFKKRAWIVKQYLRGVSATKIALSQKIHRRCVYQIIEKHKEYGWDGLKDHKTGRPETVLNPKAIEMILQIRREFGYGPCRIEQLLKRKGFGISHRQIEKVLLQNNMIQPNPKKQKPRKWVRYELPNPNDLWHTDWTHCPFTDQEFCAYIDDRTRLITSFGIFRNANSDNSIALLRTGVAEFGKPKAIMTDHGAVYYANKCPPEIQNTQFRLTLNALGIRHVLARVNRPQTNGKIERFFGSYKTEFMTGSFRTVGEYVRHYNEDRPHMSLSYKTPREVWDDLRSV